DVTRLRDDILTSGDRRYSGSSAAKSFPAAQVSSASIPRAPADTAAASSRVPADAGTSSGFASPGPPTRTGRPAADSPVYADQYSSLRLASVSTRRSPLLPAEYQAKATASWLTRGTTGLPAPNANARAAAM